MVLLATSTPFVGPVRGMVTGSVFAGLLVCACVSDLRTRRIPNLLVACIGLCGLASWLLVAPWRFGAAQAFAGLGAGLLVWFPFYLFRLIGAGDVKFFAAGSMWLGVTPALQAALAAALLGAVLALAWMVRSDGWRLALARTAFSIQRPLRLPSAAARDTQPGLRRVPYGVAMAVGLAVAAWSPYLYLGEWGGRL